MTARLPLLFFVFLLGALTSGRSQTTISWNGSVSGDLSLGANWDGGTAPTTASNAALVFGNTAGHFDLTLPGSISVASLRFIAADYYSLTATSATLRLGSGGINVDSFGEGGAGVSLLEGVALELLANQTWTTIGGDLAVYGPVSGGFALAKSGSLALLLGGANTFTGGLTVEEGTLRLGRSSHLALNGGVADGPVGTGLLTLYDGVSVQPEGTDLVLHNALALGTDVSFGDPTSTYRLTLAGTITPMHNATTIAVAGERALFLTGDLTDGTGDPKSITFADGVTILSGTNTYAGSTTVDQAAAIFLAAGALPGGSIAITDGGYLGTGFDGGAATVVRQIAAPSAVAGSIGLDTAPTANAPTTFHDTLDLSAFNPATFSGLSSLSRATLAGSVTPVGNGNYKFGGYGDGQLYVTAALPASGSASVSIDSLSGSWLSVFFRGLNSYTGDLLVSHSAAILDSATALPAGRFATLGGDTPYLGYTEDYSTANFSAFIAQVRFDTNVQDPIVGFDSHDYISRQMGLAAPTVLSRTIADDINLTLLGSNVYLGTATRATLTGTIHDGDLRAAAVGTGWLKFDTPLTAANHIGRLTLGSGSSQQNTSSGIVEFASGASTYAGGTQLNTGYTLLGASSTIDVNHAIAAGPLGTGPLTVLSNGAVLVAGANDLTLHNPITLDVNRRLQIGVPAVLDADSPAARLQSLIANNLTLAGSITAADSSDALNGLDVYGTGALTLSAANTFRHLVVHAGTVVAAHDQALGSASISLLEGGSVTFTTAAPQIAALSEGWDTGSTVQLAAHSTLTITGVTGQYFAGSITGADAALAFTSTGSLSLSGASTYSGGTLIDSGVLYADHDSALGTGTVTIGGGRLYVNEGHTLANTITFSGNDGYGGFLEGVGTLAGSVTIAHDGVVNPAYDGGVGELHFTQGLTFGSGGNYHFDPGSPSSQTTPGTDYDHLAITGTLALGSTFAQPFHLLLGDFGHFSLTTPRTWQIASTTTGIADFDAGRFAIGYNDSEGGTGVFVNNYGGNDGGFSLTTANGNLLLNFTPATIWTGGHGSLFTTASNWQNGSVPGSGTDAWLRFNATESTNAIRLPGTLSAATFAFGQSGRQDDGANYQFTSAEAVGGSTLTLSQGLFSEVQDHDGGGVHVLFDTDVRLILANSQWIHFRDGSVDLRGTIGETGGARSLGVTGAILRLAGANTFSGGVVVDAQSGLVVANDNALGTGLLSLGDSATFAPEGARTLANALTFAGPTVSFHVSSFNPTSTGSLRVDGLATLAQSLTLNSYLTGDLKLTGGLTQSASAPATLTYWNTTGGKLILTGPSSYTGGTHAQRGAIIFGTAAALPATGTITADTGSYVGLADPTATSAFLSHIDAANFHGTLGLDSLGANPNTFSNLNLSSLTSLNALGTQTSAILAGTYTPAGSLYFFGGGTGTLTVDSVLVDDTSGHTEGLHAAFSTGGHTAQPTTTSSPRSLLLGDGLTLILNSANTYSGGTVISSGRLYANHNQALGTGPVTLTDGRLALGDGVTLANQLIFATSQGIKLGGNGTFGSAITVSNGVGLAPGNSVGHLHFTAGLTWGAGGAYQVEVQDANGPAGTGYDTASVTGALDFTATINSPFTIYLTSLTSSGAAGNVANFVDSAAYQWMIADATTLTGFANAAAGTFVIDTQNFTNAFTGTFSITTSGGSVLLNYTPAAVPEPSTWALLLAGLGTLALLARRSRGAK